MSQAREIAEQLGVIREYAKLYPSAHGQIIGQETWRIVLSGESLQWITAAADKLVELEQQRDKLLAALTEIAELDILKYHHAYAIAKGAIEGLTKARG